MSPAVEVRSLNHWTTRKVPHSQGLLHSGYLEFILIALSFLLDRYHPALCLVI